MDSMVLLDALCRLRRTLGIDVHVAHLNHMIRGADADADATFCAELAKGWQLPCTVASRDVPAIARERKLAIEEAARRARDRDA